MDKKDGGYAYPRREEDGQGGFMDHPGMTLRDYFASHCPITLTEVVQAAGAGNEPASAVINAYALIRYQYADAMLAAREAK
jgi:hypothetical protein